MRVPFDKVFLMLMICGSAVADRVSTKDGSIVLEDSQGLTTALTQPGFDSDPWLSPDGRTVVFLRHSGEDMFRTSVYEIDARTRTMRLLYAGPAKYQGREGSYFGRPQLNKSHDTLFLLSKEYATEGTLISIQLKDGQTNLISDHVAGYDIIACPTEDRGNLIALKRHRDILGKPYFLYWLYSPSGKELGPAGAGELDEPDLDVLRDGRCEDPQPPVPPSSTSPSLVDAVRMDGSAMDRQLLTRVAPTYPQAAQSQHIQGDVRLQVRVAADGTVQDVNLVSGPPQLVTEAIAAVKQWRYWPVMSSGHPVAVITIVTIPFRLTDK